MWDWSERPFKYGTMPLKPRNSDFGVVGYHPEAKYARREALESLGIY